MRLIRMGLTGLRFCCTDQFSSDLSTFTLFRIQPDYYQLAARGRGRPRHTGCANLLTPFPATWKPRGESASGGLAGLIRTGTGFCIRRRSRERKFIPLNFWRDSLTSSRSTLLFMDIYDLN